VNPSFEDTVSCPYQSGDIDKSIGWTSFCGSPDYFNTCNQFDWGVPNNISGYQQAASGNAYVGFISYSNVGANTREFPACNLSSPLTIGTKYYLSFKTGLSLENIANPANCASNKIGATFTTGAYFCNSIITNTHPIFTNSIITDSLNLTRITGSFVADSAYTYLVIGNFFDDANTDTIKFFNSWWSDFAYYYLDDVALSTDSSFVYNYSYSTGVAENNFSNQITAYPNPVVDYLNIKNTSNQPLDISIYNILGELLYSANGVTDKTFSVNLTNTQKGLLLVNIKTKSESINYKFLKL
jgi:hypothetical protein